MGWNISAAFVQSSLNERTVNECLTGGNKKQNEQVTKVR